MESTRRARRDDSPGIWALNNLPNIGETADRSVPLDLPPPAEPPVAFPDLADVVASFIEQGGDFVVAEHKGHIVGMGGYRPTDDERVEILRVRVHPALRGTGIGRAVMTDLEHRAANAGFSTAHLDTATNQPEALAFYRALEYHEDGTETRADWAWTLVYVSKRLTS